MSQDDKGKIVVSIQGGAIVDVQFPPDCRFPLVVRDYDVQEVDEDALKRDEDGDLCQEFEFSPDAVRIDRRGLPVRLPFHETNRRQSMTSSRIADAKPHYSSG